MAAVLCNACCVAPCKLCTKCCKCLNRLCGSKFTGCLFTSIILNLGALVYGITVIVMEIMHNNNIISNDSEEDCGKPLVILLASLFICCIINMIFSCYMWCSMNNDQHQSKDKTPLISHVNNKNSVVSVNKSLNASSTNMSSNKINKFSINTSATKVQDFMFYNLCMALYIIFCLGMIGLIVTCFIMTEQCDTRLAYAVRISAVILFVYLCVSICILLTYTKNGKEAEVVMEYDPSIHNRNINQNVTKGNRNTIIQKTINDNKQYKNCMVVVNNYHDKKKKDENEQTMTV